MILADTVTDERVDRIDVIARLLGEAADAVQRARLAADDVSACFYARQVLTRLALIRATIGDDVAGPVLAAQLGKVTRWAYNVLAGRGCPAVDASRGSRMRTMSMGDGEAPPREVVRGKRGFVTKLIEAGGLPLAERVALAPVSYGGLGPGGLQVPGVRNVGAGIVAEVRF